MGKIAIKTLLAQNLKREMLRKYQGVEQSQSMLYRDTNKLVSQKTISNYLSAANKEGAELAEMSSASIDKLEILAEALGIEVWQLLIPDHDQVGKLLADYRAATPKGKNSILVIADAAEREITSERREPGAFLRDHKR